MTFYSLETFRPDCSVGYLLRRTNQLQQTGLEAIFAAEQLTSIQWSALMAVAVGNARSGAELAREISYDKGATTRLVDVLEANGWMTRSRQSDDRRVVTLALTETGAALAERVRAQVIRVWNLWLAEWPAADVEQLLALLRRLRGTLEAAQPVVAR